MTNGATLADPGRLDVRGDLTIGNDVFIDVNAVFEGAVTLESGVHIGPGCVIKDAHIEADADIKATPNTVGIWRRKSHETGGHAAAQRSVRLDIIDRRG